VYEFPAGISHQIFNHLQFATEFEGKLDVFTDVPAQEPPCEWVSDPIDVRYFFIMIYSSDFGPDNFVFRASEIGYAYNIKIPPAEIFFSSVDGDYLYAKDFPWGNFRIYIRISSLYFDFYLRDRLRVFTEDAGPGFYKIRLTTCPTPAPTPEPTPNSTPEPFTWISEDFGQGRRQVAFAFQRDGTFVYNSNMGGGSTWSTNADGIYEYTSYSYDEEYHHMHIYSYVDEGPAGYYGVYVCIPDSDPDLNTFWASIKNCVSLKHTVKADNPMLYNVEISNLFCTFEKTDEKRIFI
jgi:hypothetical protein